MLKDKIQDIRLLDIKFLKVVGTKQDSRRTVYFNFSEAMSKITFADQDTNNLLIWVKCLCSEKKNFKKHPLLFSYYCELNMWRILF